MISRLRPDDVCVNLHSFLFALLTRFQLFSSLMREQLFATVALGYQVRRDKDCGLRFKFFFAFARI